MNKPTLKELLEKATKGAWVTGPYGFVESALPKYQIVCECAHAINGFADAEYIARCNPATMKLVLEALEDSDRDFQGGSQIVRDALSALNGTPP